MINKLNEIQDTLDSIKEQLQQLTIQLEALKYIKSIVSKDSERTPKKKKK